MRLVLMAVRIPVHLLKSSARASGGSAEQTVCSVELTEWLRSHYWAIREQPTGMTRGI